MTRKIWLLIFINFLLILTQAKAVKAQDLSGMDLNTPMDVENPQSKQDFIQQCSENIQAQGKPASEANSYCQCSADAVYDYQNSSNDDISSDSAVLDAILQCRVQHMK